MIKTAYPRQFDTEFSDEITLKRSKRFWKDQILALSDTQRQRGFEELKRRKINGDAEFKWPDIGRIIGLCAGMRASHAAHQFFLPEPPRVVTAANKATAAAALAKMRKNLGMDAHE